MEMTPFHIKIDEAELEDIRQRLERTRWPDALENTGWSLGTDLTFLKDLVDYWKDRFDWREQEKSLNRFSHFNTSIDGMRVHFIYEKGKGPKPRPLILTHGWPSTFFEMTKIIPLLTDPAAFGGDANDAFDVMVPSLPGFGFSESPKQRGFSSWQIAELWTKLMTEKLGYSKFFAHGGDIGSGVTTRLAILHPDKVSAIHLLAVVDPVLSQNSAKTTRQEDNYLQNRKKWWETEGAYWHQQQTKPQTLAYALNDSPVGLASWILEKYRAWSDCEGNIESRFTKDELLTNVSLYWFTRTMGSSMRLYYENWGLEARLIQDTDQVHVPTAIGLTKEEIEMAPREWAERIYNIKRWTQFKSGGHFMALEEPELLAEDLRAAFAPFRG
jgi:pimeloyl-ACP methyl ester carboxylesterase